MGANSKPVRLRVDGARFRGGRDREGTVFQFFNALVSHPDKIALTIHYVLRQRQRI